MTKSPATPASPSSPFARLMGQPYLLLTLSALFWGANIIAGKYAIGELDPYALSAMRWLVAFLIILPFAWTGLRSEWPAIRRGWGWLAFYGVLGFTSFNVLLYAATTYTAAVNVAMIQAAIPVLVMVGNFAIFRVRASGLHVVGVVLTIYGVVHVATHGSPLRLVGLDVNIGDALMLLAALFYALHSLMLRYKPKIGWMSFIASTSFFAMLAAFAYQSVLGTGPAGLVAEVATMSWRGWAVVLYVALLPSIVAQMTYAQGVELIGPNRASLFINLIPVFGALLAVFMLGETLEVFHMIAAAFIIAGIGIAEYAARRNLRDILKPQ
ncbi:DMT family transporter [Pelagibacterium halotolerans]|uniref:Permease of the drug/metabolite transporter (DMT) superfamily n=1 Tax=Pelagibacterium halotolerans (strain DSM 22347 / JCM 15775 / CGMCC 1.7692 / B2) TaxID=1082931 RepID=G4R959_PELHB|nr:DMT family transporter [Pelagibacterium halotolerans]AEQ52439.1 permease of the drug/metabolite transporter (DMT) superfamily [Pelagibacterium halotolerans B2]QJR17830.1 DMT family transporter [Pelagibacterium halotolerans]SEA36452.1 Permease of the drug/metabolite transporter (DMT) superfamily [Pelagibacterium halotolerans]